MWECVQVFQFLQGVESVLMSVYMFLYKSVFICCVFVNMCLCFSFSRRVFVAQHGAAFLSISQPLHQKVMVGGQASFNQGKNSISH